MDKAKDVRNFFLLLIGAVIVIYFIPYPFNNLIFLLILPITWKSKKDYFWFAFFLILLDQPGGLFHGGERNDTQRLPIYNLTGKISFTIAELYFLLMLAKVNKYKDKFSVKLLRINPEFKLLLILFIILVIISIPIGFSSTSIRNVYKTLLILTVFYTFIKIFNNKNELSRFLNLMFPFAFIAFGLQIFGLIFRQQLIGFLKTGVTVTQGVFTSGLNQGIDRPIELVHVLFICFTASLYLLNEKNNVFSKTYLIFIALFSYVSITITATRSWFIAFSFGLLFFFLYSIRHNKKVFVFTVVIGIISFITLLSENIISKQFEDATSRLFTIGALVKGDITAEGTLKRFDVRGPAVMKAFSESTIILGSGFSDHYWENQDGHVGYQNLLFNTGIVGALFFLIIVLRLISKIYKQSGHLYPNINKLAILPLLLLLLINTGTQTIGFTIGAERMILNAFAVVLINNEIYLKS